MCVKGMNPAAERQNNGGPERWRGWAAWRVWEALAGAVLEAAEVCARPVEVGWQCSEVAWWFWGENCDRELAGVEDLGR